MPKLQPVTDTLAEDLPDPTDLDLLMYGSSMRSIDSFKASSYLPEPICGA
ncbi:hypothetical protein [Chamaesiphon minutus]|nr:hypothetical protein [Chamaesiphon minutus]